MPALYKKIVFACANLDLKYRTITIIKTKRIISDDNQHITSTYIYRVTGRPIEKLE